MSSSPTEKDGAPPPTADPQAGTPAPKEAAAPPRAPPPARSLSPLAGKLAGKALPELTGVVQGARRPGAPPPAPPPRALPPLPRPRAPGLLTDLPQLPPAADPDEFEVDLDVPEAAQPPVRLEVPGQPHLSAICAYGRYEILGRIAFGGMAEIFLGRENTTAGSARLLAIKRILPHVADDEQFVEMFLDEARLAIQLSHPNICHIYEFGELEESYFIAMEWIAGVPLGKLIRRLRETKRQGTELVVKVLSQIAEALHYAHRARDVNGQPLGIVHRDVSPHNVMISYDGHVKLLDFGIAKASGASTKTEAGVVKGKFAYMSPQQCLGKNIDARADVFALGICLYEALTQTALYQRETDYETMKAVIEDPVPSIRKVKPELPEALDAIVQKALEKAPEARYQTAGELQTTLEDWLASTGKAMTTSRVAQQMEELFADELRRGPLVDSTPFGNSFKRLPTGTPISGAHAIGRRSRPTPVGPPPASDVAPRSRVPMFALAFGLLVVIGAGAAFGLGAFGSTEPPEMGRAPAVDPAITPAPEVEPEPLPAEPAAVVAPHGRLVVRVDADAAVVTVDDVVLTPADAEHGYELAAGHHRIHVEHPERRPWDGEIELTAGDAQTVDVHLEPRAAVVARESGSLSINTRPWSKVYLGSRLLGTTPIGEARVPSGPLRLRIVDRDNRTFARTVRVSPDEETSVFFDLDE